MIQFGKKSILCSVFLIVEFMVSAVSAFGGVAVYAEGAYTESDLVVYIYADVDSEALRSAGVRIAYDSEVLSLVSAEKNGQLWYMGDGINNYPYRDPEMVDDEVVILCGKLDINNPLEGIIGDRILLGKIIFNRKDGGTVPVADPMAYFGISLSEGYEGDFANFVTVKGAELDDSIDFLSSGVTIRERGDANGDHYLSNLDFFVIKNLINTNSYKVFGDCNGDGYITNADLFCVKSQLLKERKGRRKYRN